MIIHLHNQNTTFEISSCIRKYLEAPETFPSVPSMLSVVYAFPPCEFPKRAVKFSRHSGDDPTPCLHAILKRRNPSPPIASTENPRAANPANSSKT
jgi:hypothetical protein